MNLSVRLNVVVNDPRSVKGLWFLFLCEFFNIYRKPFVLVKTKDFLNHLIIGTEEKHRL